MKYPFVVISQMCVKLLGHYQWYDKLYSASAVTKSWVMESDKHGCSLSQFTAEWRYFLLKLAVAYHQPTETIVGCAAVVHLV